MATQVASIKWLPSASDRRFLVDGFNFQTPSCHTYFLTHYHSDHTTGLGRGFCSGTIYTSEVTTRLLINDMGINPQVVQPLPMYTPIVIEGCKVTLLDANHCPGAVMLLVEVLQGGPPKVLLHTGDCRWAKGMERQIPAGIRVDEVFLDTTYCLPRHCFPPQSSVIEALVQEVIQLDQGQRRTPRGRGTSSCNDVLAPRLGTIGAATPLPHLLAQQQQQQLATSGCGAPCMSLSAISRTGHDAAPDMGLDAALGMGPKDTCELGPHHDLGCTRACGGSLAPATPNLDTLAVKHGCPGPGPRNGCDDDGSCGCSGGWGNDNSGGSSGSSFGSSRGIRVDTLLVVAAYRIGKERVFFGLARALGVRVWCSPAKRRVLLQLGLPAEDMALLADDPEQAQLHVVGWGIRPEALHRQYLSRQAPLCGGMGGGPSRRGQQVLLQGQGQLQVPEQAQLAGPEQERGQECGAGLDGAGGRRLEEELEQGEEGKCETGGWTCGCDGDELEDGLQEAGLGLEDVLVRGCEEYSQEGGEEGEEEARKEGAGSAACAGPPPALQPRRCGDGGQQEGGEGAGRGSRVGGCSKAGAQDACHEGASRGRWRRVIGIRPTGWSYRPRARSLFSHWTVGCVTVVAAPYSEHSSFAELCACVKALRPSRIIPTVNAATPAEARAIINRFAPFMDLSRDRSRLDMYLLPKEQLVPQACLQQQQQQQRTGQLSTVISNESQEQLLQQQPQRQWAREQETPCLLSSINVQEQQRIWDELQAARVRLPPSSSGAQFSQQQRQQQCGGSAPKQRGQQGRRGQKRQQSGNGLEPSVKHRSSGGSSGSSSAVDSGSAGQCGARGGGDSERAGKKQRSLHAFFSSAAAPAPLQQPGSQGSGDTEMDIICIE